MARLVSAVFMAISLGLIMPAAVVAAPKTPQKTLTMDELPFQAVEGVSINGVQFAFSGGDADYGSGGPGSIVHVQDPSIEGSAAGTLTMTFDVPAKNIAFGVALNAFAPATPGFTVTLIAPSGKPIRVTPVDTAPLTTFSEGRFSYAGRAVKEVRVTFSSDADRFVLDNLVYSSPPGR